MRPLIVLCAFAAMAGAAFAAPPPGVYEFQDQPDAQACAQVCANDTLCVAWTFGGAGKCALMAAAPRQAADTGWVLGFSPRAPAFTRGAATEATLAPSRDATEHAALAPETTAEATLLGGPDETALRARLQ